MGDPVVKDTVTGNTTYTAKWQPDKYEITLNVNDGAIAEGKNITSYTYGEEVILPTVEDVTRECHTFVGWYEDSSFSGAPETKISDDSTGDKIFYARWTESYTPGAAVKENERPATCTTSGAYDSVIYCKVCNTELSRETVTIPATGHKPTKVKANPATETQEGNIEYWECNNCGKIFGDADGKDEISREVTIIDKIKPEPTRDDEQKSAAVKKTSPQTGDNSHMELYLALLFVVLVGVGASSISLRKRKRK